MDHTAPKSRHSAIESHAVTEPDEPWTDGFIVHRGCLDRADQQALLADVEGIVAAAPLYRPEMPRSGKPLSVEMTNAGPLGWVTDRTGGYRYQSRHPLTGEPWPPLPARLLDLWKELARYPAAPEACLVNVYRPGSRLGSHVDSDEADTNAPVLSVSLGADAVFHVGGRRRSDPKRRLVLRSGDVVLLTGPSRLAHHGIDRLVPGTSDLLPGDSRINLTLRRVNLPG